MRCCYIEQIGMLGKGEEPLVDYRMETVSAAWAQISGSATGSVGAPVTFTGSAGQQSYTWNKEGPFSFVRTQI